MKHGSLGINLTTITTDSGTVVNCLKSSTLSNLQPSQRVQLRGGDVATEQRRHLLDARRDALRVEHDRQVVPRAWMD